VASDNPNSTKASPHDTWADQQASQSLQGAALTAAANAIAITDRDGSIVWVNPAFAALTGYSFAEALGKNPRDLLQSGQQEDTVYRTLWETVLAGRVWHGNLVNRRKDGSLYHEEETITPVFGTNGKITHFIAIKQDLTARREAEAKLRDSELRYRRLFEAAKDGILILDAETGTVVDVNPFLTDLLGYSSSDFLGKRIWDLGFFKDIVANKDNFLELKNHGYIRYDDKPLESSKGRKIDVEFVSNVYLVEGFRVIQCNVRDISARKASDRRLMEQNDILTNSHEGVMIVNPANQITLWNRGASEIFGWNVEDAIGRQPEQLLRLKDPSISAAWHENLARKGFWAGEICLNNRAGAPIIVDVRTTQVLDKDGRPRAILSFFTDITEKKLLMEKFLHAQRLESIGMLAAGIVHDLNNMLAPITFATPLLRKKLSDPSDLRILNIVEQSTARGASLVKQILGFVHTGSGDFQPTQVKYLLRDIVSVAHETFPRTIEIREHIESSLWPVLGNATQIHQILLNLCINARDAMPNGGTLTITATNHVIREGELCPQEGSHPGLWLKLEVADTGSGIAPEVRRHLWEPFFTTKGETKGTGLGLSTVQSIVRQHHGFIELLPAGASGTTFHVFLPASEDLPPVAGAEQGSANPFGNGELILVVDDDSLIREMVSEILGSHGYRTEVYSNGSEAINSFGTHAEEISLVITDVDMPVLGGQELARALLRIRPDIRLLFISGLVDGSLHIIPDDASSKGLSNPFLLKPFTPSALLLSVASVFHPLKQT
jgi:PAS domain S-box-containing protein